jgi:hypothetical protein
LMANLSEDIGEETPLQVSFLCSFFTREDNIEISVNLC